MNMINIKAEDSLYRWKVECILSMQYISIKK